MGKLSSYQKLKKRIQELEKEKRILIKEPDSMEAMRIRSIFIMGNEFDEAILQGSRHNGGNGILDAINRGQNDEPFITKLHCVINELNQASNNNEISIKTGKMLIEIFNASMSKTTAPKNDCRIKEFMGVQVEEVDYYPANVFSFGDKSYRIEGNSIKEIEYEFAHYSSLLNTPHLKMPSMYPTDEQLRNAEKDYFKKYGEKVTAYPGFGCIHIHNH